MWIWTLQLQPECSKHCDSKPEICAHTIFGINKYENKFVGIFHHLLHGALDKRCALYPKMFVIIIILKNVLHPTLILGILTSNCYVQDFLRCQFVRHSQACNGISHYWVPLGALCISINKVNKEWRRISIKLSIVSFELFGQTPNDRSWYIYAPIQHQHCFQFTFSLRVFFLPPLRSFHSATFRELKTL